ncbi:MAG: hypothetical protein AAF664_25585, partial [Planctomycetota bacterium]
TPPASSQNSKPLPTSAFLVLIGFCCIGFWVADVITPSCLDYPIPFFAMLGVVTAQLTAICVWGTLARIIHLS